MGCPRVRHPVAPPAAQVLLRPPRQGPRGEVLALAGWPRGGAALGRGGAGQGSRLGGPEARSLLSGGRGRRAGRAGREGRGRRPPSPPLFLSFLSFFVSRCINAILCVPLQEYPLTNAQYPPAGDRLGYPTSCGIFSPPRPARVPVRSVLNTVDPCLSRSMRAAERREKIPPPPPPLLSSGRRYCCGAAKWSRSSSSSGPERARTRSPFGARAPHSAR